MTRSQKHRHLQCFFGSENGDNHENTSYLTLFRGVYKNRHFNDFRAFTKSTNYKDILTTTITGPSSNSYNNSNNNNDNDADNGENDNNNDNDDNNDKDDNKDNDNNNDINKNKDEKEDQKQQQRRQ